MSVRPAGSAPAQRSAYDTSIRDRAIRDRRRRLAAEQAELLRRVRQALLDLREPLGVRSAYIVGSVLSPERWTESSDVDVAVGGCSRAVLDVMKALEDATGKAVDVIDLDRHPAPESFLRSGVRVYG
jgi:predicted nucleotidyltransferase